MNYLTKFIILSSVIKIHVLKLITVLIILSTTNITLYVNKLENTSIGQFETLPNLILHNQGINSFITNFHGTPYRDFSLFKFVLWFLFK